MSRQAWENVVRLIEEEREQQRRRSEEPPRQFGQDFVGDRVSEMDVLEDAVHNPEGISLKLGCPECGRAFWAQLWEGGQNSVVRRSDDDTRDEILSQCPGCGVEWTGRKTHYYAIASQEAAPGPLPGVLGVKLGILALVEAPNAFEAPAAAIKAGLIPGGLTEDGMDPNLMIMEVSYVAYRLYQIEKRLATAMDSGDPKIVEIFIKGMQEKARIAKRKASRQDEPPQMAEMAKILGRLFGSRVMQESGSPD